MDGLSLAFSISDACFCIACVGGTALLVMHMLRDEFGGMLCKLTAERIAERMALEERVGSIEREVGAIREHLALLSVRLDDVEAHTLAHR